jgi:nucleotide-binding universal stress UspA family protein
MQRHSFEMVVGVDLSEYSDMVLQHAFDQAVRHDTPSLHVVSVVPDAEAFRRPDEAERFEAERDAKRQLFALAARVLDDTVPAQRRDGWRVRLHVRRGRPEQEIVDLAAEVFAGLIVVGRFGWSARDRRGIGSIADRVVQLADCPVLVVGPPRDTTASDRQCAACVAIRAESDGEQWFCQQHHADYLGATTLFVTGAGVPLSHGGQMW